MNQTEDRPRAEPSCSGPAVDEALVVGAVREYLALVEAGDPPDRNAFAARYPQIAEALAVIPFRTRAATVGESNVRAFPPPAKRWAAFNVAIRRVGGTASAVAQAEAKRAALAQHVRACSGGSRTGVGLAQHVRACSGGSRTGVGARAQPVRMAVWRTCC
jgi:hypothetical protein